MTPQSVSYNLLSKEFQIELFNPFADSSTEYNVYLYETGIDASTSQKIENVWGDLVKELKELNGFMDWKE